MSSSPAVCTNPTAHRELTDYRTRLNAIDPSEWPIEQQVDWHIVRGELASSSREVKTDFVELDGKEVLAKLAEVPVASWRYKTDQEDDRHVGPVAEDFHAAFQIGDDKTIANIDADGVALAAIQGLHEVVQENRAELTTLLEQKDQEITELRQRLAVLEERLGGPSP